MFSHTRNAIGLMLMLGLAAGSSGSACSAASASNATGLEGGQIFSSGESEFSLKVDALSVTLPHFVAPNGRGEGVRKLAGPGGSTLTGRVS
jgi:hypothetical protein